MTKRELSKFFCGAFAGLAFAHFGVGIAMGAGIFDEPIFLGRSWGVGYTLTEAAVYTAVSVALGYRGWRSHGAELPRETVPVAKG